MLPSSACLSAARPWRRAVSPHTTPPLGKGSGPGQRCPTVSPAVPHSPHQPAGHCQPALPSVTRASGNSSHHPCTPLLAAAEHGPFIGGQQPCSTDLAVWPRLYHMQVGLSGCGGAQSVLCHGMAACACVAGATGSAALCVACRSHDGGLLSGSCCSLPLPAGDHQVLPGLGDARAAGARQGIHRCLHRAAQLAAHAVQPRGHHCGLGAARREARGVSRGCALEIVCLILRGAGVVVAAPPLWHRRRFAP